MESLKRQAARILREQKKYKLWLVSFLCLAVLVTAGTVAALTMSGQALNRKEKVLTCKLEVHRHTEQCRDSEGELTCGQADYAVHVHNDDCYGEDGALVCALPEKEPHVHDAACFEEQKTLVCTQEESAGHQHGPECYTKVKGELTCGQETAGHQHGPECYTRVEGELTCGLDGAGHQHGPECYIRVQGELTCTDTEEGHEHTDECYAWSEELACGQTEEAHVHTEQCYAWSEELTCGQTEGAHVHTDECHAWSEELTCQIPEGEGAHTHTDKCYETETVTICGELELHTHDKASCYDKDGNLICGETELLEHVHGEGCFEIIEPGEEAPETAESEEASENKEASGEAQESTETLESEEEDGDAEPEDGETSEETEADGELQGVADVLTAEGSDYTVTAAYGEDAGIPEGARLSVREILQGTEEYDSYYRQMLAAMAGESDEASAEEGTGAAREDADTEDEIEVSFARFFDIAFMVDGEKIEPVPGAAVDIRISYKDAVELGEDATASAVHFAKDGTEVLDAAVTEAGEGSDFAFTQDSFSVTSTVVATKAPKKKTTKTLTATAGDVSFTVTGETEEAFLKSDRLVVNEIKDNGGDAESGNNRYRKYLNNSEGAIKKKNDQQDEEMEVFSARVFEISVVDSSEQKKQTGNVKVEIQYNNAVKAQKAGSAVMVLNSEDSGEVLSSQAVSEGQEVALFSGMQTFSASASNVVTTMVASAAPLAEEPGSGTGGSGSGTHISVAGYLTSSAANDWQIVDQGYAGNEPSNKTSSSDGKVRVQKNVIPTDVENEFLVYLSIDMKELFEKYFEIAVYKATTSNNFHSEDIGTVVSGMTGNQNVEVSGEAKYSNSAKFTILDPEGKVLVDKIDLYWSQANNVTFYLDAGGGKFILLGLEVKKGSNQTVQLSKDAMTHLETNLSEIVSLGTVSDSMGDNIEFLGIVGGDYGEGTGIDAAGRILTWVPAAKTNAETDVTTTNENGNERKVTWLLNVAELVYRVRLDVTKQGFNSCADNMNSAPDDIKNQLDVPESYPVNESATLTYDDGQTVEFSVPQIRGLLYDHELTKTARDKDGNKLGVLEGAVFTATGTDGDGKGKTYTATSGADGKVLFTDMPWGTYTIEETTVPDGYGKSEDVIPSVTLCYTKDKTLVSDKENNKPENMIQTGEKSTVVNIKSPRIILKKEWIDNDNKANARPEKITFTLTYKVGGETVAREIELLPGEEWTKVVTVPSTAVDIACTEKSVPDKYVIDLPEKDSADVVAGDAVVTEGTIENPDKSTEQVKVYTITNKIKGQQVQILKIAEKKDADNQEVFLDGAVFEVYDKDPDTDQTAKLLYTWTSALVEDRHGMIFGGELETGTYWLKEITAPEDYGCLKNSVMIEVGVDEVKVSGEGIAIDTSITEIPTIKITDKLNVQQVLIRKKALEGDSVYLDGAIFEVYDKDPEAPENKGITPISCWTSRTETVGGMEMEGVIYSGKLQVGTYWLVETKAPDGFNLPENAFVITVLPNGVTMGSAITETDGTYSIYISNSAGYELPETGGMGVKQFTIGGTMLVTAAAFLMYGYSMRRRKSERRSKK